MSQAPTDGMNLLDPWGFWKTARDTNLEAWSKFMIDIVNSDEYAQATGLALEQALATSQPLRDATERTMTQTLSLLNMPSRAEVITIAERLVNVEMRLDDLDAKLTSVQKSLQQTIKEALGEILPAQSGHLKNVTTQLEALDARYESIKKIETQLSDLAAKLSALQAPPAPVAQPVTTAQLAVVARPAAAPRPATASVAKPEPKHATPVLQKPGPKPEPKPAPKATARPAQPATKAGPTVKEQEAK
jgi:hypothetical protein